MSSSKELQWGQWPPHPIFKFLNAAPQKLLNSFHHKVKYFQDNGYSLTANSESNAAHRFSLFFIMTECVRVCETALCVCIFVSHSVLLRHWFLLTTDRRLYGGTKMEWWMAAVLKREACFLVSLWWGHRKDTGSQIIWRLTYIKKKTHRKPLTVFSRSPAAVTYKCVATKHVNRPISFNLLRCHTHLHALW